MKINKQTIRRIIKEELEKVLGEQDLTRREFMAGIPGAAAGVSNLDKKAKDSAVSKNPCPGTSIIGTTIIMKPISNFFELMRTPTRQRTNTFLDVTLIRQNGQTWSPADTLTRHLSRNMGPPYEAGRHDYKGWPTGQDVDFSDEKKVWKASAFITWAEGLMDEYDRSDVMRDLGGLNGWVLQVKDLNIKLLVKNNSNKVVRSYNADEFFDIEEAPQYTTFFCK